MSPRGKAEHRAPVPRGRSLGQGRRDARGDRHRPCPGRTGASRRFLSISPAAQPRFPVLSGCPERRVSSILSRAVPGSRMWLRSTPIGAASDRRRQSQACRCQGDESRTFTPVFAALTQAYDCVVLYADREAVRSSAALIRAALVVAVLPSGAWNEPGSARPASAISRYARRPVVVYEQGGSSDGRVMESSRRGLMRHRRQIMSPEQSRSRSSARTTKTRGSALIAPLIRGSGPPAATSRQTLRFEGDEAVEQKLHDVAPLLLLRLHPRRSRSRLGPVAQAPLI